MSILPLVSHANKGTPCWKGSGEISGVVEALNISRMAFERVNITPTTTNGVFGSISGDSVFNNATAVGWAWMNPFSVGSAYVVDIYLTANEDGTPDGFGNIFTGITIGSAVPTINLSGLIYANYNGTSDLYLGFRITSPGTDNNSILAVGYSGGTCAYNNQFSYASWTTNPGVPVVLICE
jgi:hypothetical protein